MNNFQVALEALLTEHGYTLQVAIDPYLTPVIERALAVWRETGLRIEQPFQVIAVPKPKTEDDPQ